MFVVDTNVLVYAANKDCPEHGVCHRRLSDWRQTGMPWFLTWGIVYEFLRVTTHPRVFRSPLSAHEAHTFIRAMTAAPTLRILTEGEGHGRVVEHVIEGVTRLSGNLWHDAHVVALMHEHGIKRIYTRDTDFHHFPGIEVLDPLQLPE